MEHEINSQDLVGAQAGPPGGGRGGGVAVRGVGWGAAAEHRAQSTAAAEEHQAGRKEQQSTDGFQSWKKKRLKFCFNPADVPSLYQGLQI